MRPVSSNPMWDHVAPASFDFVQIRPQRLQRDRAAERRVHGAPHLPHAAAAEAAADLVVTDVLADE